jgi:glycosyltransferase involved in cell wall biosynthesis/ubiquinone/menaquinone biosynthesis C-methylase UbiE
MNNSSGTIVILTPAFPEKGPATTWVYSQQLMVKALKENYPQATIVVLTFLHPNVETAYEWNNVRVIPFNGMGKRRLKRLLLWRQIWKQLKNIHRENKITGILSFWCGECALIGSYFGKWNNIKHLCWICGQDARAMNKLVNYIRPRPNELVAMSTSLANEFYKNHGIQPQYLVPNAIDPQQYPAPSNSERTIDILGTGSLELLKQYDLFVNVVKAVQHHIPAINTLICGEGPDRTRLESLIKEAQVEKNIHLPGLTPHHEVLQLMQRSKIFLHTSSYEGFSTVCLEALYAGCHVISFCNPGEGNIPNWHIVRTVEEMSAKANELLLSPTTTYKPVLVYSMSDSAKKMMHLFDNSPVIEKNISYYNEVAAIYNNIMAEDAPDQLIRHKVKEKLLGLLPPKESYGPSGRVLDFGGGTGLDLGWLTAARYTITFCEPAAAMREKAIEYNNNTLHNTTITFLDTDRSDFTSWHKQLPFPEKMDAILSNFGALNYIPNIDLLFNNLARVIKPGGHFIALILEYDFKMRFKKNRRNALASFFSGAPFVMYIPYKQHKQTVIIHTAKEIKKAAQPWFDLYSNEPVQLNDFIIIHLIRNETAFQETVNG